MGLAARSLVVVTAALSLGACGAMNTVHFGFDGPDQSGILSVDAKLRNTVIFDRGTNVKGEVDLRYCSEDGPSAMAAGSFSLAGVLGIGAGQRDLQVSQGGGETVASLEHTQTVNLLHKSLYRTCELWASGALDQGEFYALAARTHRSMVAVLAVEQMTGVVRPRSTIISGPAVQAAVSQSQELIKLLQGYKDERIATKSAWGSATANYNEAAAVEVEVESKKVKACSLSTEPDEAEAKPAYETCTKRKAEMDAAKTAYDQAVKREDKILDQLAMLSRGLGAATMSNDSEEGGLADEPSLPSGQALQLIAKTVENIALTAGIDESLMICANYLKSVRLDPSTRTACNQVIVEAAKQDREIKNAIASYDGRPLIYESGSGIKFDSELDQLIEKIRKIDDDNARKAKVAHLTAALGTRLTPSMKRRIETECGQSAKDCTAAIRDHAAIIATKRSREIVRAILPDL